MLMALVLYLALLALIAVNLAHVLDQPLWYAAPPVALAVAAAGLAARRAGLLLPCLTVLGLAGLVAAAAALVLPAWQVIDAGASGSWAGRMAPMFVAALALYGANLWMDTARARGLEPDERIARLLAGPQLLPALVAAVLLAAAAVLALDWAGRNGTLGGSVTHRVLERGIIPPATVLLFCWGFLLLLGKWWNGLRFSRALSRPAPGNTSIDASLRSFFEAGGEERMLLLWRRHDESYLVPRYLCWALPVLGFIGTVLGISLAADGIRGIIASGTGITGLSSDLGSAIAPLGIAFDTTLVALTLSIVLTLMLALVQRGEARALTTLERRIRDGGGGF